MSRAFSFLFSISSCPRREAYFYLQPYASARAAFSTPCRTHERHSTIHSETWSLKGFYGGNQHYLAILPRVLPGPQVHRDAGGQSRHAPRHAGGPRHHGGLQGEKGQEPQKQGTAQHTINKYWKEYNIKEVWRGKGWRPSNVHPPPTHHATRPPQPYALPFAGQPASKKGFTARVPPHGVAALGR